MKNYTITSLENVNNLLNTNKFTHLISITRRLPIINDNTKIKWYKVLCEDTENPYEQYAPTQQQISNILNEIKNIPDNSNILIHCEAGYSRSPALTLSALVQDYGIKNIQLCVNILKNLAPYCFPNKLITHYADVHLNTNNEITNAAEKIANELIILKN